MHYILGTVTYFMQSQNTKVTQLIPFYSIYFKTNFPLGLRDLAP